MDAEQSDLDLEDLRSNGLTVSGLCTHYRVGMVNGHGRPAKE